ncbi:MAG: hypothetical protein A2007_03300 [Verrucomicrobia bacterium GWC2_42_7]|nr:MAG: hypothetical protein A2007_03300 [Verrucomicrobia bacterium GWC2_42_7]
MEISINIFFGLWILLPFLFILGVSFYYDRIRLKQLAPERYKTIFHCLKCGLIYSQKGIVSTATCPRCDRENGHLKF